MARTIEEVAEIVKVTAIGRGIILTNFKITNVADLPPQRENTKHASPPRHSRIYAEVNGGAAIGRFRLGLEECGSMDLSHLQEMLIRKLDDSQWESNPH